MVTGHRDIRGESALLVRKALINVLASLRDRHPEGIVGVSGMAVGADAEFTHACIHLGIPFVAAIPVEGQDSVWPWHARERYADQIGRAALVVNVWEDVAYLASSYGAKMHARNRWMLDHVATGDGVVLAVWDGRRTGGTWAAVDGALKRGRKVLVLDPVSCEFRLESPPQKVVEPEEPLWPWDDGPFDPAKFQGRWEPIVLEEPDGVRPKGFFEDALVKGGYLRTNVGRMFTGGTSDVIDSMRYAMQGHKKTRSGR
jgi:hypothetical protein